MSTDPREAAKLLKEIDAIYQRIGAHNPFSGKSASDFIEKVYELQNALDKANDILHDMDGGVNDLFRSWKGIVEEVGGYNKATTSSKRSISSLMSITEKLKDHQKGITNLSSKTLKSLQEQYKSNKDNLKTTQAQLKNNIVVLENKRKSLGLDLIEARHLKENQILHENIQNLIDDKDSVLQTTNKKLEEEARLTEVIEKKMGVVGGLLKGVSRIPFLKGVVDADKTLEEAEKSIRQSGKSLSGLKSTISSIGSQMKDNLLNPSNLLEKSIIKLFDAFNSVDDRAGVLAKSMNLTYHEAILAQRELTKMSSSSFDVALNTRNLSETLMFIGKQLSTNATLNEADLKIYTKLREQAGYTNEELYGIQQLSLVNNKTLEKNTEEILGGAKAYASRNKLILNEKEILREVSKTSATIKLSLGGSAEAIAEAAAQAKQFGLNLEQADKIAQSLLQFESSIESELSAELLLGKNLTFEYARQLALNNDIAGATEEIAKQVGTSADFAKMNAIQQEAIAKAAGITKDELAQSLMNKEALAKISAREGETAQQAFNRLVEEVGMEEAKKKLGEESLANQFAQQSIQERFTQSLEKIQELFVKIAEPILAIVSPIADVVGNLAALADGILPTLISGFLIFKGIQTAITTSAKLKAGYDLLSLGYQTAMIGVGKKELTLQAARNLAKGEELITQIGIAAAWAVANPIQSLVGLGVAGVLASSLYSMSKGNDVVSPGGGGNGYGNRTLLGPEGAIQLNDKDTIIAGTKLFENKQSNNQPTPIMVSNSSSNNSSSSVSTDTQITERLDRLIRATEKSNSISTLKIQ